MTAMQQNPDGSWKPATPLGYQPGYDVEWYGESRTWRLRDYRRWVLYRTTREDSVEIAHGKSRLRLWLTLAWCKLTRPVKP